MKLNKIGPSETTIETDKYIFLFSYNTPVACIDKTCYEVFKTSKKHSVTTSKHIKRFLDGREAKERPQEWFDDMLG